VAKQTDVEKNERLNVVVLNVKVEIHVYSFEDFKHIMG
jgi:hypothetical protein